MVHIGGFFMGLKKSHRISNFLLHQIAYFCGQYIKKKPLKYSYFTGFHDFSFCKSGATSTTKHNKVQFHKMPTCYDSCYFVDFVVL